MYDKTEYEFREFWVCIHKYLKLITTHELYLLILTNWKTVRLKIINAKTWILIVGYLIFKL